MGGQDGLWADADGLVQAEKISSSELIFRREGIISERFRYSKTVQTFLC